MPYASAAIACAPPTRYTCSPTPATTIAAATAGFCSSVRGGVTITSRGTPATRAGIALISTEDG